VAALANSLLLDYLGRPFVGIHMSAGILNKLPWLVPADPNEVSDLLDDVLRLTCTRAEFGELARVARRSVTPAVSPAERAECRSRLDAAVARLYRLTVHEWARVLGWFRLLDQDQPALDGEPKSFITRDLVLLAYFRLLAEKPPQDIIAFFREAGLDVAPVTGSIRDLEARVETATALGAVAYVPSRRAVLATSDEGEGQNAEVEGGEDDDRVPEVRPRRAVRPAARRTPARGPRRRRAR
jgi:hypothetical protein